MAPWRSLFDLGALMAAIHVANSSVSGRMPLGAVSKADVLFVFLQRTIGEVCGSVREPQEPHLIKHNPESLGALGGFRITNSQSIMVYADDGYGARAPKLA